jgi:hypothetical protein
MDRARLFAIKARTGSSSARCGALVLALMLTTAMGSLTWAVDEGDHLKFGQDLVDEATAELDKRVAVIRGGSMDTEVVFSGVHDMVDWLEDFRVSHIAERYRLDEPIGLLVTDGIADTLATRLGPLLEEYGRQNPEENLSRGRQTYELLLSHPSYQLPTGRFIGAYMDGFTFLFVAQADTLIDQIATNQDFKSNRRESLLGVYDGVLRHLLDITRLYDQVHREASDKYFCRLDQEDAIPPRSRCTKCGHLGLKVKNIMNGLKESTDPECAEPILHALGYGPDAINARFDCRYWAHIFDLECPECAEPVHYAVPLPFFKVMQRDVATGKIEPPDISPLIKEY